MFKIGEFSRLSHVTVKTLRFYDELGLLKPVRVDDFTSYRYYSADQMPRLNRILALKDLGFTLDQIAPILVEGVSSEQIRGMFRLKQSEIKQRMQDESERLSRVEARLQQIERENSMSDYEVIIKSVEPLKCASVRQVLPNYAGICQLIGEVYGFLGQSGIAPAGPCLAIWYDGEYKESDVDGEALVPITGDPQARGRVKIVELPRVDAMATLVFKGPYIRLHEAYTAMLTWLEENGYVIQGYNREIYLQSNTDGRQDDESCVTEIQFPVSKAA